MWQYFFNVLLIWMVALNFVVTKAQVSPLLEREERESALQPITWKCINRIEADRKWKHFQSKGYPNRLYVSESRCSWKLSTKRGNRIKIAFGAMDLQANDPAHCSANYLEIIDENLQKIQARYCGQTTPGDIVSSANRIRIDFQAQSGLNDNMKGFLIGFVVTKDAPGFYKAKSLDPKRRRKPPPTRKNKLITPAPSSNYKDMLPDTDHEEKREKVLEKAIIGIVIGFVVMILIGVLFWWKTKQKRNKTHHPENEISSDSTHQAPKMYSNSQMNAEVSNKEESYAANNSPFIEQNKEKVTYINCQPPPLPLKNTTSRLSKSNALPLQDNKYLRRATRLPFDQASVDTRDSSHFSFNLPYPITHTRLQPSVTGSCTTTYENHQNNSCRALSNTTGRSWKFSNILDNIGREECEIEETDYSRNVLLTRSRSRANKTMPALILPFHDKIYLPENQSKSLPIPPALPRKERTNSIRRQGPTVQRMEQRPNWRNLDEPNRPEVTSDSKNLFNSSTARSRSMWDLNNLDSRPPTRCKSISYLHGFHGDIKNSPSATASTANRSERDDLIFHRQSENAFEARSASRRPSHSAGLPVPRQLSLHKIL